MSCKFCRQDVCVCGQAYAGMTDRELARALFVIQQAAGTKLPGLTIKIGDIPLASWLTANGSTTGTSFYQETWDKKLLPEPWLGLLKKHQSRPLAAVVDEMKTWTKIIRLPLLLYILKEIAIIREGNDPSMIFETLFVKLTVVVPAVVSDLLWKIHDLRDRQFVETDRKIYTICGDIAAIAETNPELKNLSTALGCARDLSTKGISFDIKKALLFEAFLSQISKRSEVKQADIDFVVKFGSQEELLSRIDPLIDDMLISDFTSEPAHCVIPGDIII